MHYRSDIDGLRAVAVLSVLAFHYGLGLSGGFIGVDVFFVISGFLITRIILTEQLAGTFSLLAFYQRRIRRIFPALIFVLLAAISAGWIAMLAGEYRQLGRHAAAADRRCRQNRPRRAATTDTSR